MAERSTLSLINLAETQSIVRLPIDWERRMIYRSDQTNFKRKTRKQNIHLLSLAVQLIVTPAILIVVIVVKQTQGRKNRIRPGALSLQRS